MAASEAVVNPQPGAALPDDVCWRVLQSPNLSLADLALLAPTCHSFRDIYREARAAEEAWLDGLAASSESMFGPRVLAALCEWLFFSPRDEHCNLIAEHSGMQHTSINIREGATDSEPPGKLELPWRSGFEFEAPAWGLQGDGGESKVMWTGNFFRPQNLMVSLRGPAQGIAVTYTHGVRSLFKQGLGFCMRGWPAPLVPTCIGLLHRILEEEALKPTAGRQGGRWDLRLTLPSAVTWGSSRCNAAVYGGGELQRTISALLMRHWRRWRITVCFDDPRLSRTV